MADVSGRKVSYGIAKEGPRGIATTPTNWIPLLTFDFQNKSDQIWNESVFGVLNKNSGSELVKDYAEGKLEGKVTDQTFGLLLYAALGNYSGALHAAETLVKDHTFTQSQANNPQSLTITRVDGNTDKNYPLAMLKSLEITVVVGEFVKYVAEFVSKKGVAGTDTVAYVLENEFKAKFATAKTAATTAGLGAASAIPMKSFKIKIARKVNPYYVFGSNDPNEIFVEDFETSGEFVLRYTDQTYENYMFNNTVQALQVAVVNTSVTIGTSANPALTITLPKADASSWKIDMKADGIVEQTVGFMGLFDFASSTEISAVLTNSKITSY
ncbi:phage tail tube protein [Nakamurella sp. PAMC28650]|uniref:phage tail tube protein n=1 Tax=Nakamurella sp. PAMC28650 TaxID=2762325 RepID=UPI00164E5D93|nr:phage tail tube protein [Nakamurella sp. PAMC28650]QNK82599.1 hypothetical protein H7F38_07795 [Nakamurella sp. PAMC28650]